jgi:hypothetical protein
MVQATVRVKGLDHIVLEVAVVDLDWHGEEG